MDTEAPPPLLAAVLTALDSCPISYRELGRRTGLSPSVISQIATRSIPNPGIYTVQRLADALEDAQE